MTAMTLDQIEERMQERRASFARGGGLPRLRDLLDEALQVLAGGLQPTGGPAPALAEPLRRDLGLR